MNELKKPSMLSAILLTLAALLDLLGSFMMVMSHARFRLLIMFLFAEMILIACAITVWVSYFKQYCNFEIETRLRRDAKQRQD